MYQNGSPMWAVLIMKHKIETRGDIWIEKPRISLKKWNSCVKKWFSFKPFYIIQNGVESVLKWFWGYKTSISTIHDIQKHFQKIFQKVKIGHRYHFFALHAFWSCFGAWKTTFWAWSLEFCKAQYCSYNPTREAGASMSPYLKSLGPDFWYWHYFLKKLNFSNSHQQNPSKMLKNCLQSMRNSWKKSFLKQKFNFFKK